MALLGGACPPGSGSGVGGGVGEARGGGPVGYLRRCGCVGVALLAVVHTARGGDDELKPFLERVVTAVGGGHATGVKAWTQTSRLKTHTVGDKTPAVYRDFVVLPDRFRQETDAPDRFIGKKTTCVVVGDKGWMKFEDGEVSRLNSDEVAMTRDKLMEFGGAAPLIPLLPGIKASMLGESKIGDRTVVGVRAVPTVPAEWSARLYYDKETARLVLYEEVNLTNDKVMDAYTYSYEGGKTVARRPGGKASANGLYNPNLEVEVIEFKLVDSLDPKLFEPLRPAPRTAEMAAVEWVEKRGRVTRENGSVVGVSLISDKVTDAELKELVPLKDLRKLDLSGNKFTGAGLKHLAPLEKLEELDLSRTSVGDAGLKELAAFPDLRSLDLMNAGVTDAGLKHLAPLTKLRSLNLWNAGVTDAGLKALAPLKGLQSLNLTNAQVTDAGLKELAPLEDLRSLDLSGTEVTDAGLTEVARHKGLESLGLTNARVTDAWLAALAPLKHLRELNLWHTRVTDLGMKQVARHKGLQSLNLSETEVTDAGLAELAPLKDLRLLNLSRTRLTDAALKEVARHEHLQTLFLEELPVTDAGLKELAPLTELRGLYLRSKNVTDAGLKELARFRKLERLMLGGSPVTGAGMAALKEALPKCNISH
jgi:internalin A